MKQGDIAALILVVVFSLMGSWVILNAVIPEPTEQQSEVEKVEPISADFPEPDMNVFAEGYLNPTELINIEKSDNPQPFRVE